MSNPPPQEPSFLPGAAATTTRSVGGLIGIAMRRPGGRKAVSALTALLCVGAVSIFAFPAVTDLIGAQRQRHVSINFGSKQFQTEYRHGEVPTGSGLTKLIINN